MCFKKAVAKSSGFSRIFAFGLMIFSGAGLINLCTVCAETTDELQGPPVAQSHIIGIDPGHQSPNVDMSDLEPLGPGSTEMKAKASTGTQGTFSGLPEYQLNLDVSLKLQQILEDRGRLFLPERIMILPSAIKSELNMLPDRGPRFTCVSMPMVLNRPLLPVHLPFPPPLPILMYPSSMMIPTAFPSAFWMPIVTQPDLKTAA